MLVRLTEGSIRRHPWALAYRWFGSSQIDPYDPERGAAFYVGKYITKSCSDYDYWTRKGGYGS